VRGLQTDEELVFTLNNIHFHKSSEHTIDGKNFSIEMHMVHSVKEGYKVPNGREKLVLGVLFEFDEKSNIEYNQ